MYGYSESETLGKTVEMIIPPEIREEYFDYAQRTKSKEDIPPFRTKRLAKNGRQMDVMIVFKGLKDENGQVDSVVLIERKIEGQQKL